MKCQCFEKELEMIKNDEIREDCKTLISLLPDYFFLIPASSTGKYHPDFALGDGGLVRHTKVAVRIAYDILNLEFSSDNFSDVEKDLIIMTLILHDGFKSGFPQEQYTRKDHPLIVGDFVLSNKDKIMMSDDHLDMVISMLKSHMGEWNKDRTWKEVLPKPIEKRERFVHMCDYLSSRQYLDVKFDKDNNLIIGRY